MAAQLFGRYELLGTLGEGGFSTVYRARDSASGDEVALKMLHPYMTADREISERFYLEWQTLARIHHPNIVAVRDVGEAEGRLFYSMELIDGRTLQEFLAYGHGMDLNRVISIIEPLASAIDWLHAAGLVHCDLKAANVMVDQHARVVLMDFGIVHLLDRGRLGRPGERIGTPDAMAPEQVKGQEGGPPADIYALGVLTYQLLSGRLPFTGNTAAILHAHAYQKPPSLESACPGLPDPVYRAVSAALAKEPRGRPRTAAAFVEMLAGERPARAVNHTTEELPPPRGFLERWGQRSRRTSEPTLVLSGGGVRIPLSVGAYLLGRDETCDIRLDDSEVSREHARITVRAAGADIEDLDSTNGTFVNEALVTRVSIAAGDVIRLGGISLQVNAG